MRTIQTIVSTGDEIRQTITGLTGKVGIYKHGEISIHWKINDSSQITERVSTRKLNQLIKSNIITKI